MKKSTLTNQGDKQTYQLQRFVVWLRHLIFLTLLLMVLGALVRATDSGLACPDWPLCYNQAVPYFNTQVFLEWFHRCVAGAAALLFAFIGWKLLSQAFLRKLFWAPLLLGAVLLIGQIILGGLTVLRLLEPKIVTFHLINAVAFVSILMWVYHRALTRCREIEFYSLPQKARILIGGICAMLFVQIFLGGMVSTNHAGLVCPDFPTCLGRWFPPPFFIVWLQMAHRYLAVLISVAILVYSLLFWRRAKSYWIGLAIRLLPLLVIAQIVLGAINVLWQLPVWASVLHLANALAMFSVSFMAVLETWTTTVIFQPKLMTPRKPQQKNVLDLKGLPQ